MPSHKLDPIDRKILAELQADGRMTNVELSRRVGISAPPCLRRVRALEEQGFIRGYHAELDARELGLEVQVFAMVGLSSQAEADLSAFEAQARAWPLVRECHMLNGEIDFILKCVAPDLSTFQSFLTGELTAAPNVASVKTSSSSAAPRTSRSCPLKSSRPAWPRADGALPKARGAAGSDMRARRRAGIAAAAGLAWLCTLYSTRWSARTGRNHPPACRRASSTRCACCRTAATTAAT
jgi:DNA-binding Lrp family transcriptional regulator